MKNKYLRCINTLFLCCLMAETTMGARFQQPSLKATYNKPAKVWESEALPIGNGYMGAMIFGGVEVDVIQTKILQKSGIQKNEVIELIYRGFI